ncbi:MAG: 2-oxoacid:acceptor oxidoreductase family protein [Proteobacteria bacterium]|nr:2-oxoacid:acceptor oxidoreductase family protein [Pseudomonadota bacterium]
MSNILEKPKSFYTDFTRKGSADVITTHYCPGCGHGILHKMIAEAISELGIQDRTVFISPVGCSVFAYYYFDTGNVQVAHGRAPAAGTGVKRALPNSIVISYQGDGDLAAIGTAEIIHSANRGEAMTMFFVNNAIYGMTGGQMAPTSIIGQKTTTSPYGRKAENEGYPIKVSELISQLDAPVYVERVSLADVASRNKARTVVRKAIQNQIDGKGFSFVEVLAACPSGLKKTPLETNEWVKNTLHTIFPLGCYKDETATRTPRFAPAINPTSDQVLTALNLKDDHSDYKASVDKKNFIDQNVKIAGFGGQGVLSAGTTLSVLAMYENLEVSWIPSYGPEMRGGTSNCNVRLSNKRIGSPLVENPNILIAMNGPSLEKFESAVRPGGTIIVNSSIIDAKVSRKDVKTYYVPVTGIATEMGVPAAQGVAALAAYLAATNVIPVEKLEHVVHKSLKRKELADKNIAIIRKVAEYITKGMEDNKKCLTGF